MNNSSQSKEDMIMQTPLKPPFTRETALLKVKAFLRRKWAKELDHRLMKNCGVTPTIASRCVLSTNGVMRTRGNEHWEFDAEGLMQRRDMSANEYPIQESERRYR
jgi:uncharacterized protein